MVSSEAEDSRSRAQDGKQGLLLSEVFVPFPTRPAALPQTWRVGAYLSEPLGFCELPFIMYWGFQSPTRTSSPPLVLWHVGLHPFLSVVAGEIFFLLVNWPRSFFNYWKENDGLCDLPSMWNPYPEVSPQSLHRCPLGTPCMSPMKPCIF